MTLVKGALGIVAAAAYVPRAYIERRLLAAAWGVPAQPGTRSAAGDDEDSLTLAVEAGRRALEAAGMVPDAVDLLLLASTTLPYQEKQNAGLAAAALDLRHEARTVDVTGSLRCGLDATALAADALLAGSASCALVLAADCRLATPGSAGEQSFGDGGAALLLDASGELARIEGFGATHRSEATRWRSSDDHLVRAYETRLEKVSGYGRELPRAAHEAMESARVAEAAQAVKAYPESDRDVGDWGSAAPLLALVRALEEQPPGTPILWAAPGDGAAAAWVVRGEARSTASSFRSQLPGRRVVAEYGSFAAARGLVAGHQEAATPDVSAVAAWRREDQVLGRRAGLCMECGTRQYPAARTCIRCAAQETQELVVMAGRGAVYTFTLDHLENGVYQSIPTAKCVLDLEDGTRFYAEMSDGRPEEVRPGLPVELVFRLRSRGGGYRNYGWKCRPLTGQGAAGPAGAA